MRESVFLLWYSIFCILRLLPFDRLAPSRQFYYSQGVCPHSPQSKDSSLAVGGSSPSGCLRGSAPVEFLPQKV